MSFHLTQDDNGKPAISSHDKLAEASQGAVGTLSTSYSPNKTLVSRVVFKNSVILYYDDQGRVIRVDGFIPALAPYPVSITAQYGYDVFVDILGLPSPV